MTFSKTLAVAALCVAGATTVDAWSCSAHMITAEIARANLEAGVEAKASAYFEDLQHWGPFPQSPDMVSGACWADDLKTQGLPAMSSWHYMRIPIVKPDFTPAQYATDLPLDTVASELQQLETTAASASTSDGNGELGWGKKANNWEVAFAMANVVNFMGDVHQPLHAANLFSSQFPTGDNGGELFTVQYQGATVTLHDLWDTVCGQYTSTPARPLNATGLAFIQAAATKIASANPSSSSITSVTNATAMAQESNADAIKYAYASLSPGDTITPAYVAQCTQIAEARLATAGYRMAAAINAIFKGGGGGHHHHHKWTHRPWTAADHADKLAADAKKFISRKHKKN